MRGGGGGGGGRELVERGGTEGGTDRKIDSRVRRRSFRGGRLRLPLGLSCGGLGYREKLA